MSDSDIKFIGFGAMWFAIGSAMTLTLGVSSGFPEWMPSMFAATGTAAAIFVIMLVWELGPPFWRGLTGKASPPLRPFEGRPRPPGAIRPPPPPAPPPLPSLTELEHHSRYFNYPFGSSSTGKLRYMALSPTGEWRVDTIRASAIECLAAAGGDVGTPIVPVHLLRV